MSEPTRDEMACNDGVKKRLKVALVMGGGVSLGAFNGGAIAEITKQLRGNLNPRLYDTAEIDVLSGAGGLTLAEQFARRMVPALFADRGLTQ